jgi:hypothetical protein
LCNPKRHGLAIIQQPSNRDKHRLLSPILVAASNFAVKREDGAEIFFNVFGFDFTGAGKNLKIGTEIVRCHLAWHPDDKVEVTGYPTPDIRLPQRSDILLMDAVGVMIGTVEDIVADFAASDGV